MSFTTVSDVRLSRDEADLLVSWTSSQPDGTIFQIYLNRALVWAGTERKARVPYDGTARSRIDVGYVGASEVHTDYSGSLPSGSGTGDRVTLTWLGGTYLDSSGNDDIQGFRVYMSTIAGGAISYASPVADIAAYGSTDPMDGFGLGGFGGGGFGRSDSSYTWTSNPLGPGVWQFAVKPYDVAGNEGTGSTVSKTISAPPRPPAVYNDGTRLRYSYNATTHVPTLTWQPSP